MCGRFITTGTWAEYRRHLNILPVEVDARNRREPNYNVAPTSELGNIVRDGEEDVIAPAVWSLIPQY